MQSIQDSWQKIKAYADAGVGEWGLIVLLCVAGIGSFGLGRLSALEDVRPPISISVAPSGARPEGMALGGQFVASISGRTYYFPWCSGAQTLKSSNEIWFRSEAEAQAAGYTPAKNCKGR